MPRKKLKKDDLAFKTPKKRKAAMEKLMKEINRGAGNTVLRYGDTIETKERIPFSIPELNELTGGGIPCGLFSVIWGAKSAGKTSLSYDIIAQAQKKDKVCLLIDFERSFNADRAREFGINVEDLLIGNFKNAEEALDVLKKYAENKLVDLVVIDSIQGMSPKGEQETKTGKERSLDEDTIALLARKLSQFFRMGAAQVDRGNVAVLLIGQARMNLGGFIALETLSGGHALHHWASLIVRVRRGQKADAPYMRIKDEDTGKTKKTLIGFDMVCKIDKTKISSKPELTDLHLPFYFETGFKHPGEVDEEEEDDGES